MDKGLGQLREVVWWCEGPAGWAPAPPQVLAHPLRGGSLLGVFRPAQRSLRILPRQGKLSPSQVIAVQIAEAGELDAPVRGFELVQVLLGRLRVSHLQIVCCQVEQAVAL